MITAIRQSKVRLPQLSMRNLDKSKERSNKPTIRSNNIMYDSSTSPLKTRTDNISRGSLSTPLQYCRYSQYNICRVDSSFNDQEIFNAQQKSVPRSENMNQQGEQMEKLSQRLKNMTNHKKKLNGSISNQQPQRTEPYISKQPRSPKIKHFKTEDKVEEINAFQKKSIQEKIKEIYEQVQTMLKSHKGYVRQAEKKNVYIQLVQLKKEFRLLNQDYNEFYSNNSNSLKIDFEIVDRIEELKKLFESGKPVKNNSESIFQGLDISFPIQTEMDEKSDQNIIQEISEKDQEQSQDQIEQFTDQMTDCSPSNSTFRRRMTNLMKQRQSKQYTIQPIQVQPQNQSQQTQGIRRQNSSTSLTTPLTPESSARTSRRSKISQQQILQQRLNQPQTPPKIKEKQFQEDQNEVLKKEIQKRQTKMLSRKATIEAQQQSNNITKRNSRTSLAEVIENSEGELKISKIQTRKNSLINQEQQETIVEPILDLIEKSESKINETQDAQKIAKIHQNEKLPSQNQKTQFQIDNLIKRIVLDLSKCNQIYDQEILNKNRKNKQKTQWSQDIESILQNYNQFF